MEAPDALKDPAGTPVDDEDRRDGSPDGIREDDGDSYRRECDRVLDEDSDSGEPEPEADGEDVAMDLERTDQEVITESTNFGEQADNEKSKKRMEISITGEIWHGTKEKVTKKPPPLPTAPGSERSFETAKGTVNEGGFPQQYFTIKANRARSENPVMLGGAGGFCRVGGEGRVPDSRFDIDSDSRKFAVKNYHRLDVGRNISASVTVVLGCLACASPHSIREELGMGNAKVVVLSDQAFPPHLPTDDGKCVVVIRVEDGVLSELVSVFNDIFANFVSPVGRFAPGSVILLGSLSHLGKRGICNYTEELVRCIGSLSAGVGAGVEVVPMVFFPMGGIGDPGVVRDAHDLDSWIMGSALGTGVELGGAQAALWEELREAGGGGGGAEGRALFLPTTFRNPRKRSFYSAPTNPALPCTIPRMSEKAETRIISVLLHELVQKFGVSVNTNPILECGSVTPVKMHMPGRLIIVGALHMMRLAKHLPNTTINLAYPGFKATPQALTQIVAGLEELRPNKDDTVILDLLSNSSFMGTDEEGLPTPATAGEGGTYHIPGSLVTSPGPAIKKILANCNRLGKLCASCHQVTLVAPIPRYVTSRCCNNSSHVENYENDDFESDIIAGIEMHKKLLDWWAMEHNLNFGIVDATELVDPVEPVLRNRVTHGGIPLWTVWDPVHLVDEAYKEMAEAILMPSRRKPISLIRAQQPAPNLAWAVRRGEGQSR